MSMLKEATFTLNGKYNYHLMHKEEQVLLKDHVDLEDLLEEINSLYTNVEWLKAIRCFQLFHWSQEMRYFQLFLWSLGTRMFHKVEQMD